MKIFTLLLACIVSVQLQGQAFKAVTANEADYFFQDADENGNPIGESMFMAGCSWYCGGNVQKITASSSLTPNNSITYEGKNAHDFNPNTAWVEGKEGHGIGESITYEFNFDELIDYSGRLGINQFIIGNGYRKSKAAWENNARIKQLALYVDGSLYGNIDLLDQLQLQTVAFEPIMFPAQKTTTLTFVITQVYPGSKYKDTALSILVFDGVGVH